MPFTLTSRNFTPHAIGVSFSQHEVCLLYYDLTLQLTFKRT